MDQPILKCAVCNEDSKLKCTGCNLISYCSKDHQKKHWSSHKPDCVPYKIVTDNKLGRHLVASRDIKANTIILSELPFVVGPRFHNNYELLQSFVPCLGCYEAIPINTTQKCPKCQWPVCSEECPGLKESHNHAAECAVLSVCYKTFLSNIDTKFYRYTALIILRCLILQRKCPKKWEELIKLQSHVKNRGRGTEEYKEVEELVRYLQDNFFVVLEEIETEMTSKVLDDTSSEIIHVIAGILDINALDIHYNDHIELSALYPTFSLLEHSCLPNTHYMIDLQQLDSRKKFRIIVKAAGDIKKGDHLSTMYTHALWGTKMRRKHLFDCKYFRCECKRCVDPTELGTYISGLKCLIPQSVTDDDGKTCGGIQLPVDPLDPNSNWSCNRCGMPVSGEDIDFLEAKMSAEVDSVLAAKISDIEDVLNKLSRFLHPNHYLMYQLKHSLIQLYGMETGYKTIDLSENQLQRKIDMCKELTDIHSRIDPYDIRLQLYVIVILYEQHTALMELAKREFKKQESNENVLAKLREVRGLLKKCSTVVQSELQTKTGFKLNILLEKSNIDFEEWVQQNAIAL